MVHRSQLKNATYNPRVISADAKRKLRTILKKLGVRSPPTWNQRTGNICGGHQRIDALDALDETGGNYNLTVAMVNVSDKEEIEINLALNNAAAQGDFEMEKLEAIFRMPDFDPTAAGWDASDAYRLFGDAPTAADPDAAKESVKKALDQILSVERASEDAKAAAIERDREDYYIVVVFRSYAERKAFTDGRGLEDNRYQSAEVFDAPAAEPS